MTALEFDGLLDDMVQNDELKQEVERMINVLEKSPRFLAAHFIVSKGSIEDMVAAVADTSMGFVLGRHFEQSRREVGELEKMVS